ncbi:MAG: insulinase family protein [Chroococcidiopsidaceae cyanobacterium CP_BM_ER_R8_30]|nr:insulinase family protein [Chroococcidiopsidaceae cyanobacterium CP_BM_ER_R8_30]
MTTDNRQIDTLLLPNQTIKRTVLDNGIVVLVAENLAADIIATRIFVRAGSCWDGMQSGLAHLLSAVLTKGTVQLSSWEIAEQVESVGAHLSADAAADYFLLSLKTVSADFAEILALAGQLLRSPTFPEIEVELEQRLALQDIRSQQEQPLTIAFEQLRQAIYKNHPYASSGLGYEATVSQLGRNDLQRHHQTYFRPDNLVISIAGRVTTIDAVTLVEQVFGDWQISETPLPTLTLPPLGVQPEQRITSQNTQQSIVMLGYLAPSAQDADYAALKLLANYLGNGLSSRLFVELREKRGLAYEVSAFYPTRQAPANFVVYMGTAPENTVIALLGLQTEVELLCSEKLSEATLQAAKNKLLGQYALSKQTNAQIAQLFGWYETLGLGVTFDTHFQQEIMSLTAAQLQQAACQYLLKPYVSVVGPEAAVNLTLETSRN